MTSCVVEAADAAIAPPKPDAARRLPKAAQTALRALHKAIEKVGAPAPASNHIPPTARVVTVDQWRAYAYQSGISDTADPDASFHVCVEACLRAARQRADFGDGDPRQQPLGLERESFVRAHLGIEGFLAQAFVGSHSGAETHRTAIPAPGPRAARP
jgi:hypothetical protein